MPTYQVVLTDEMADAIDLQAKAFNVSRSCIIRQAVSMYKDMMKRANPIQYTDEEDKMFIQAMLDSHTNKKTKSTGENTHV